MRYINQHSGGGEINKGGAAKSAHGGCVLPPALEKSLKGAKTSSIMP